MVNNNFDVPSPNFEELQKLLSNQRKISEEINKQLVKFEELQAVLSEQSKISNEIDKTISKERVFQAMIKTSPEKIRGVLITLVKKIIVQNKTPIIVLTTFNSKSMNKLLVGAGIDLDKIKLIDCVTRNVLNAKNTKQIQYVDSLRNLTQLQIKIIKLFEKDKNSVFVFDSLDVLSLYHKNESIFKFAHAATKILRQRNLRGYFIFTDLQLIKKLSQFFDNIIEIK
jgi:hypothetical protein